MVTQVKRRREGWKDRVAENHVSLREKVMRGQADGKRPRGRPRIDGVTNFEACS